VLGKKDLDQRLELQRYEFTRLVQPCAQRALSSWGDPVDRSGPLANRLVLHRCQLMRDQLAGFLIQFAFRARPEVSQAGFHLLGQLVGGPRLDREQAEDGI
jgi:hypothetical protein